MNISNKLDYYYKLYEKREYTLLKNKLRKIALEIDVVNAESPDLKLFIRYEILLNLVDVEYSFMYAEFWYKENDYKSARNWVVKAKQQARKSKKSIKERIRYLGRKYNDRILFWRLLIS